MRVALFGAGGFIGSNLAEHLVQTTGHDVVGVDITADKVGHLAHPRFEFLSADVRTDDRVVDDVVGWADIVVNLIAYANPSIYVEAPLDVVELNYVENLRLVRRCVSRRTRLLQYSSAEIYGKAADGDVAFGDDTELTYGPIEKQRWIYACAKQLLERVLHAHGARGDLDYTVIRPFNFVGPRIDYLVEAGATGGPRVFPHFLSALLADGPLQLVDGGQVHRSFTHIDDASAAAALIIAEPDRTRNTAFNVGNPGNNITIRDLALLMRSLYEELTGRPSGSQLVEIDGVSFYGEGYEDGDRHPPDVSKLEALGWQAKHDLRSTLRSAMAWYLEDEARQRIGEGSSDLARSAPA